MMIRNLCLAALVAASCMGLAAATPVAQGTGAKMCVLTPADFHALGITVESKPSINIDQNGTNVYCVYRGKSGATGGVELDVFFPAGNTNEDVLQTFKTVLASDPGADYVPEDVPGADESQYSLRVPQSGHPSFAANAVRRGSLVFSLSFPSTRNARSALLRLSKTVLERLAK